MKIELKKVVRSKYNWSNSGILCCAENCKQDKRYITPNYNYLRVGTTCMIINGGNNTYDCAREYYCEGCIDDVYAYMRGKLDPKLRAFA